MPVWSERLGLHTIRAAVLLLALVAVLPAAMVAIWAYQRDDAMALEQAYDNARVIARSTKTTLDWELETSRILLARLAREPAIRALLANGCQSGFRDLSGWPPIYTTLWLRRVDGSLACSVSSEGASPAAEAPPSWFGDALARGDLYVSDADRTGSTSRWSTVLTLPVADYTGRTVGLLGMSLDLKMIAERLFSGWPSDNLVVVVGRDRRVVLRSQRHDERVGQPVPARFLPFLDQRVEAFENVGVEGERRLYAQVLMPQTGWLVTGTVSADTVLQPQREKRLRTVAATASGLLLAFAAAWWLLRRLVGPVQALADTARAVQAGQTAARAPVSGPTELKSLAQAFNGMLDRRDAAEQALRTSEQRFRTLSQLSSDWYWEQDAEFRFVSISESVGRSIDITDVQHIGKRRWELPTIDMDEAAWDAHRAVLARHEPFYDFLMTRPGVDGGMRYVSISGMPLFDADGRFTGYCGVGRDITAARQAQSAIEARERRFRVLLEQLPAGVVVHRGDTSIEMFNPEACRLLHMTPDQMLGRTAQDPAWRFLDEHGQPMPLEQYPVVQILATREPLRGMVGAIEAGHEDDRTWVLVHGFPEIDVLGQVQRVIVVFIDITLQRKADALRVAGERAAMANAAKSSFLSRMSHELRTPLNAVLGFASLLAIDPALDKSPTARQQLDYIERGGNQLLDLVNDLLDIARIEGGALTVQRDRVDLGPLVRHCVEMQSKSADRAAITLRLANGDGCTWAWGDESRIRQVLTNLLSNAIKYNRAGGAVDVAVAASEGMARVDVSDTGPGLDAAALEGLFEPFNRLGADQRGIEGTGLGLVISRELAQAMGGSLRVRSTPGQGSTFSLLLPLAPAEGAVERTAEPAPTASIGPAVATGQRQRVLCVEDNPTNAEFVRSLMLQRPDIDLELAATGAAGVAAAMARVPDLVLIDIALPDFDGVEVLRRLREVPALAQVPCVAVSANALAHEIDRALAAGFQDYLTKPVVARDLLTTIDHWLREGRIHSA